MPWPVPLVRLRNLWRVARARYPTLSKVGLGLGAVVLAWSAWFAFDVIAGLPGRAALRSLGNMAQATTVYDVAGRPVFAFFKEQRIEVPLSRISPHLVRAVVAVEDRRFFEHRGVDSLRVLSAAWHNLLVRRAAQGGSTITQQLARQSFLTSDKTLRRKLKEAILAARIEGLYSKDEILELYLNKVYLGDGLYGAEAAARGYFGKAAADLDLAEAALLAGLVKSPSTYAPTVNLERAIARRNVVLRAMRDQDVIDRDAWERATQARVKVQRRPEKEAGGLHFKEQVRRELIALFGDERVYEGGLHVYTTIDPAMQRAAEAAVARSLRDIDARRSPALGRRSLGAGGRRAQPVATSGSEEDELQAALVALDPRTGEVRALVGGRDVTSTGFNRATQAKRQPGSAFKPFVYAAALEGGYSPATVLTRLDEPITTVQGAWLPDDHSSGSSMTIRTALRTSSNRAAVRMLEEIGIGSAASYAQRLGLGAMPQVPSMALGSGEVTLLSMTRAYAAFAAGGIVRAPLFIRLVIDAQGVRLFQAQPAEQRAVSESTAFLMSHMLADVIDAGTGSRARREGFSLPAAGKTGTTNEYVDAWFVGFTPNLVTGVWVGFDQRRTIMRNGYAADLAVPLWARFMRTATSDDKPAWFRPPPGIVSVAVCRWSGKRPSAGCYDTTGDYFVRGTEPRDTCDVHDEVHSERSIFAAIGDLFRGGSGESATTQPSTTQPTTTHAGIVPPPPAQESPAPEIAAAQTEAEPLPPEAPKKKRGFWKKIFGIGKD